MEKGVGQGCVFSPNTFNLCSEMILGKLTNKPGFINGRYKLNIMCYADVPGGARLRMLAERIIKQAGRGYQEERTDQ